MGCNNLTPYNGDLPYDTSLSFTEQKQACSDFRKWQIERLSKFLIDNTDMMCLASQAGGMINYKGKYNTSVVYKAGDVVLLNNVLYISNIDNNANTPPSAEWDEYYKIKDKARKCIANGKFLFNIKNTRLNIIQSLVFDNIREEMFTLQLSSSDNVYIEKFDTISYNKWISYSNSATFDTLDCHQGLAIGYYKGERYFFTNKGSDGKINIFKLDDNLNMSELTTLTVFGASSGLCTTGSNKEHSKIIVEGIENNKQYIAIYDIRDIIERVDDDLSEKYLYKSIIPSVDQVKYPLQGTACDDRNAYVAYGDSDSTNPNYILVYDYIDDKVIEESVITVGEDGSDHYEQEGISWFGDVLVTNVMVNTGADRLKKVYSISQGNGLKRKTAHQRINGTDRNDVLLDTSIVCGDTSLNLDSIYFRPTRIDGVAFINLGVTISGFSVDLPNDNKISIDIDIYKLAQELGVFYGYAGGYYSGTAYTEVYDSNGNDYPAIPMGIKTYNNRVNIYGTDIRVGENVTISKLKINANFSVGVA